MKKLFRKAMTVLGSALMVGATIGMAAAASYPAPFVQSGSADVAIVYGSNAAVSDAAQAGILQGNLATALAAATATGGSSTTATVTGGDVASLASGSDLIYLNDELNENVATLTKDDLSTVLADATFTDNDGTDYDYEQILTMGTGGTFAFGNSDNDLDNPILLLNLATSSTPIYTLTATFDSAVNFTASASEGEVITLFGKTYTVGTATDSNTLVLLGGSDAQIVNVGETKSMKVNGMSYEVTLNGISSATVAQASITVNGVTKTFTEGQTKEVADGVDLFAKTVFRTGDNLGHVELELGADRLTFEDGSAVMTGSDNTEIEGTNVLFNGGSGAVTALTSIAVQVFAPDNDANHIAVGDDFTDPVFGTVKVKFQSVQNGPVISGTEDTSTTRNTLSIDKGGNEELLITATDAAGNTQTIPFVYASNTTTDDNSEPIHLVEGTTMTDDDYFTLNSGNYQHFMQLTKVDADSSGQVTMKDLFTGTSYSTTAQHNFTDSADTLTISGQTYTVTRVSDTSINVTTDDYTTNLAVYPYIKLVSGEDQRFAIVDTVTLSDAVPTTGGLVYELPTGSIQFNFSDNTTTSLGTYKIDSGNWAAIADTPDTYTIGSVDYVIATTVVANVSLTVNNISLEATQSADGDTAYDAPVLLFVEDEDKSETVTTTKNAVLLKTSDIGSYTTVLTPVFTSTGFDTESFDDTDFTGYLTNFGTYVLFDSSNTNQDFASLTYPKSQMYANVFVGDIDAVISGGTTTGGAVTELGNVIVEDSEVTSVSSKNLIVVGGSCINTVAADLLGSTTPVCSDAFTTLTGVSAGGYLIQSFERTGGKVALLVAGYNAADTVKAVTYLTNNAVNTEAGKKYTGTSATEASLVTETA